MMFVWKSLDGKWEVINDNGVLKVKRYGEDMTLETDNLHLAMLQYIEEKIK
jgi:hypothetical protein